MKIGVWHNTGGGGGARRHLYHHLKLLRERGHEIVSCCPDTGEKSELDIGSIVPERRLKLGPLFSGGKFNHPLRNRDDALQREMARHCEEAATMFAAEKIDLLFATNCQWTCIPAIARFVDVPSVMYIHDPHRAYDAFFQGWAYPEPLLKMKWWSRWGFAGRVEDYLTIDNRRKFLMHNIANAGAFSVRLTNSYFCREQLLRSYGLPVQVSYQGVDTSMFRPAHLPREPFLLGVGSFWVHKNIEFVIKAVSLCRQRWPLCWVGNSGNQGKMEEYRAYARKLGVDFRPVFNIDDASLVDYLNRASLHVCAALLEPFGLTPLEAGACRLPVLATREGGMRETVKDGINGVTVDFDEAKFAGAIDHLMDNPALREQLGAGGLQLVRDQWTLEHSVDRLEQWFVRAVERGDA